MTLAVEMRPEASPHIGVCQMGTCKNVPFKCEEVHVIKSKLAYVSVGRQVNL